MVDRNVSHYWPVTVLLALMSSAPTLAGENTPGQWNQTGASQYLDRRGENWFKFSSANRGEGASTSHCVSCHSLLPYALARPVLRRLSNEKSPTEWETKTLAQTKLRVANWSQLDEVEFQLFYDFDEPKKQQSRGTEAILNALVLALDDQLEGRPGPGADTKKAMSILWATQLKTGEHKGSWDWLNFGLEPWESNNSRYLGRNSGGDRRWRGPRQSFSRQRRRLAGAARISARLSEKPLHVPKPSQPRLAALGILGCGRAFDTTGKGTIDRADFRQAAIEWRLEPWCAR